MVSSKSGILERAPPAVLLFAAATPLSVLLHLFATTVGRWAVISRKLNGYVSHAAS